MAEIQAEITGFFDRDTCTASYLVADPSSGRCAIVDPVLDFAPDSARTSTRSADEISRFAVERGLTVEWILETHVHADHVTAAAYLKDILGGRTVIGAGVGRIQRTFRKIYHLEPDMAVDGSQFDRLLSDGERLSLGSVEIEVLATPGHTPICVSYRTADTVFVGDTLFMPDSGTARCDFPGGDPATLYRSIRRILSLPPETRMFLCHDYGAEGRGHAWETTVGEQHARNIHVKDGIAEADFVAMRRARDETLAIPKLMLAAIQMNIRAGRFPAPEKNGRSYLKIPLNRF